MNDSLVLDEIDPETPSSNLEDSTIAKLAETVYNCAVNGTDIDVVSRCIAVMIKLRGIPPEGIRCRCNHCFMEPNWRYGPVAGMNGSCGAHAWKFDSGSIVEPGPINSLVERTWDSVSKLIDRWGQSVGDWLSMADYRTINQFENGHSFSPLQLVAERYPDIWCLRGRKVIVIGSGGTLNGAGMDEQYPGTGNDVREWILHDDEHFWVDCAAGLDYFGEFETTICPISQIDQYACVSHSWGRGRYKGKGTCATTEEYRQKHVCDKECDEWDERDIEMFGYQ
ncbi:hypothetical protein BG011_000305 [Mortierella polycephala]|uniref:Uncharacterized protein n=1 Tax=Mortierella polycephala TaxID=41804 RepID=A0A9P6TVE7_9FUNG|nr:hypothetical protein BG011_000305 [Mortierella polycephala]